MLGKHWADVYLTLVLYENSTNKAIMIYSTLSPRLHHTVVVMSVEGSGEN